ncbi:phosphoglycerate mutase family protein [Arenibacter sp. GZD96]|uniref:SixA phosphatase family protein n=1 Tax=Aurantibrevibacter litoralis TaxID=3106030 RepID=UPI002AFE757B|nr:phosphoglycerate mutase family protein [Arenibacter sp. GZD-96]MEA1787351.1 phosphoglycerate mutase family protein [Arenibacter sp. GZD-96]
MKINTLVLILIIFFGALSCKDDVQALPERNEQAISTFYFIRHAEKDRSNPENLDPELNQDGLGRAIRWAEVFHYIPLDAIYSTDFERTEMTAAPTAVKQDLVLQYYSPENFDVAQFKEANLGKNVLVVGHSNSIPELVNKMLGEEKYEPLDDYDNSSLFIIRTIDGRMTDIRLKMD